MTRRKSKADLEREIREALSVHRVQFRVPGSPWVYVSPNGNGTTDRDAAVKFRSREAADAAVTAMTGPRSSLQAKAMSTKE